MKILICILLPTLLLTGCGTKESAAPPDTGQAAESMVATEKLYTQAADKLVSQYSKALMSTLMAALNENGPAYAVYICQAKAQDIAVAHSAEGWSVKRVSEKWRNIMDRPDTGEVEILKMFANPETGDDYLTNWSGPDSARVFHYYRKIVVSQMCLQCHGDLQTVDLDLYKKVKIAYPYDKATGYKVGDLRGMFVIKAQYPAADAMAQLLADGVDITEFTLACGCCLEDVPSVNTLGYVPATRSPSLRSREPDNLVN